MNEVPALQLSKLEKTYSEGQQNTLRVLRGLDLQLKRGEIVGLIGPSGSGKSTLLQIAGLLDVATSGSVRVSGQEMTGAKDRKRTRMRRNYIGFVYQFHHLLSEFSACENVALPIRVAGFKRSQAFNRANELLIKLGLKERAHHRPGKLSGGERQRVALARALANRPALLLADEPTGNLDPETSKLVFDQLLSLVRDEGLTALIATHNIDLASHMDRVVSLNAGVLCEVDI